MTEIILYCIAISIVMSVVAAGFFFWRYDIKIVDLTGVKNALKRGR